MNRSAPTNGQRLASDQQFERANVLAAQGKTREAEPLYRSILDRDPRNYAVLLSFGLVLTGDARFEEAVKVLRRALKQQPNSPAAHNALGVALYKLGRRDEAMEHLDRVVAIDPGCAEAHANRSMILSDYGRYDAMRAALDRAIELAPDRPSYHQARLNLSRIEPGDPSLAALERLVPNAASLPPDEQVALEFALGKAYADLGEIDRSFRHQLHGAAMKRRTLAYDEVATLDALDGHAKLIGAQFLRERRGSGNPSDIPIFIFGMPRSGTTLVEQILGSHPEVMPGGERQDFESSVKRACGGLELPSFLARASAQDLKRLGDYYLGALGPMRPPLRRMTDKMPANFCFAGLIHLALPNARMIHVRRDSVDTCLSNFSLVFADRAQPFTYNLGELGRYYRAYERLMTHWRAVLPDGAMLEVRYEDVVEDLPREARRIVGFCGLEWNDACLAFHESKRPVRTASHLQVRRPIYRTSVGRPRPSPELLQPLIDGLEHDAPARPRALSAAQEQHLRPVAESGHGLRVGESQQPRSSPTPSAAPRDFDPAITQAIALVAQGRLREAEAVYRSILDRNPRHYMALQHLGAALTHLGRHEEAVKFLRRALNQKPNSAVAQNALAVAFQGLDRLDEAATRFQRALALAPDFAEAYVGLASVRRAEGRYDEARAAIDRAIVLEPGQPSHREIRATMSRFVPGDPELAALEKIAASASSLPTEQQIALEFVLGKAYADLGEIDRSFRHQIKGGALKRSAIAYDEARTLDTFAGIARSFDAAFFGERRGLGHASDLPVFIFGMPRSGTTLVEQILASHPAVMARGERSDFMASLRRGSGGPDSALLPRLVAFASERDLKRLGSYYLEAVGTVRHPVARVTDKMPANFRFAGLIHLALPNARMIHMRRDPIDTCLSNFAILFNGDTQPFTYNLAELGRYYRAYERLMVHWRAMLPERAMIEVRYEDLVDDLPGEARRIIAHCGLDWDDACLAFYDTKREVATASHMQVRSPIYRSSVGRPRPSQDLLRPLLEALQATN